MMKDETSLLPNSQSRFLEMKSLLIIVRPVIMLAVFKTKQNYLNLKAKHLAKHFTRRKTNTEAKVKVIHLDSPQNYVYFYCLNFPGGVQKLFFK